MPKIDLSAIPAKTGSAYPGKLSAMMDSRVQHTVGDAGGLNQFGVNLVTLAPGAMSALRHWHEQQDEFAYVTMGALTLVDDNGDTPLTVGDCIAFPAGDPNGHCIVNKSQSEGQFLVVGTRTETEVAWYPDLDMKVTVGNGKFEFTRKDGSPVNAE